MKNNYLMKLGLLLYLLIGVNVATLKAQTQNWYFGDHAGIKFTSSGPTAITNSAMLTSEGCSVLSDATGELLAYSNGEVVWDSHHQPMPNGSAGLGGSNSTSQGALFLPLPGSPTNKVYLFCLDAIENNLVGGLRYSILDFALRGGLGDVTATKGVVLPTPVVGGKLTEKLTAVRHANGRDYWVVVHGWQSNTFYSFLLSPTGISTVPVVSNVGIIHQGGSSFFGAANAVGCMRASPDGRHLALAQRDSQCELYDFDNATGSVSNYLLLAKHDYTYGVEFSPDNSKLYTTYSLAGEITQYDLLAGSPAAIVNSATRITSAERLGDLLLGPDNKIYVVSYNNSFLHVIQNPNAVGAACNYKRQAVSLAGLRGLNGLPNFANIYAPIYASFSTSDTRCAGAPIAFTGAVQPAPSSIAATWSFGDPASGSANAATGLAPTHTYATAGTYQVTLTVAIPGLVAPLTTTQSVVVAPLPQVNLGSDVVVCASQFQLAAGPQPAGSTYRWQDGSTAPTYLAQASGRYSVAVTSAAGCTSTAFVNVTLNAAPIIRLPADTLACAASVVLRPRVQLAGSTYRWQDGSTSATYLAQASGRYSVAVTSAAGCTSTAFVNVILGAVPALRLPADTATCSPSVLLRPGPQTAGSTYRWQDGSTASSYLAQASGRYSVAVTSAAGCTSTAFVNVTLNAVPRPRLPADTTACAASVVLRPGGQPAGSTYRWQDGSTSSTYLVQASGTYSVVVTTPQGCTGTATSRVGLGTAPRVSLGADTLVCPNAVWTLRVSPQPAGTLYRWQDGSTAPTYLAHGPGQYSVEVRATAAGCSATATRLATAASCPVFIPNIITPNGDTENEFFLLKGLTASDWHLSVFDRWGRQVYDQARYDNRWNATGQASGMYYYLLSNKATGERYRGWVEVQRGG
jgi:gliding motility-associated-like protein